MLAIQNMTWNGELGFQEAPSKDFIVEQEDLAWQQVYLDTYGGPNTGPQGVMGKSHFERGLMWVENYMAGHMVPMYQPRAAYKQLQWVLGHIDEL
jgi:carboxypeptidase D